jgi:peptide/nickel transport system substrate-binding protein
MTQPVARSASRRPAAAARWRRFAIVRGLALFLLLPTLLAAEQPVIYLRQADAMTLDPGRFEDFYSQEAIANIFEGLVRLRPDRVDVEPCLAVGWDSRENGKRWLFHLRRGVRFHDGTEFKADAVVVSFKRRMAGRSDYGAFARIFPFIVDVRAQGDHEVEFVLARPYGSFLLSLVDLRAAIVAPAAGVGAAFKPLGTGPFMAEAWSQGKPLVLRRHPGYWGRPPGLERLVFKSEKTPTLRLSQIRNGAVHAINIRSAMELASLADRREIGILSQPSCSTHYLGFNCLRPPFDRAGARRAFAFLLNKDILVKRAFQETAVPAASFLPPGMAVPAPAPSGGYSLAKARQLLQAEGLANGFACTLYYTEGQFGIEEIVQTIAAKARLVKIAVNRKRVPFERFFKAVNAGEPDFFLMSWGFTADPAVYLNPMFQLVPGSRRMMAMGPDYARILARAETTVADDARRELYAEAQRLLLSEAPLLPLFHLNEMVAYSRRLHGLRLDPLGFLIFADARLADD